MRTSKLYTMAALAMMSSMGNELSYTISTKKKEPEPEWKRKKCKSCKFYVKEHKYGKCSYPLNQACSSYQKK